MKKELVATGFVFLSFMLPSQALAADFSSLYVFGDSLSDTGNIYNVTKAINPNQAFPPSPPYFNGRFSNGLIWVDYLGTELGLKPTLFTELSTTPPTQGINFAFGGASSGLDNAVFPKQGLPGVLAQVGLFTDSLKANNQTADPNALYAVWGGANDFLFPNPDELKPPANNISNALGLLAQAGAKNILLFNLPNLAELPAAQNNGRDPEALEDSANEFNQSLATAIAALNTSYNLNIFSVNTYSLFNEALASPSTFGFSNVTEPCLTTSGICANPDDYLFWDDVHPTTKAHKLVANKALLAIKSQKVPEPSVTLGMLTLGALGAAAMLKRQQKKLNITPTNQVLDAQSSHIKVES